MIYLFTGTPGSGKSLDMARCILNDVRFNKPVICNFPVNLPKRLKKKEKYFNYWSNDFLSPAELVKFSNNYFKDHHFSEGGINLYIDECQILFNARTWNAKGRSDWNAFFTNHRHFGYDIVLVCQFDRMLDNQIRSLVEVQVVHRKLSQMGLKGLFFRVLFLAPTLFVKVSIYYPLRERTGSQFYRYSKKYASIYDSYTSVFITDTYKDDLYLDADSGDAIASMREVSPEPAHKERFSIMELKYKFNLICLALISCLKF